MSPSVFPFSFHARINIKTACVFEKRRPFLFVLFDDDDRMDVELWDVDVQVFAVIGVICRGVVRLEGDGCRRFFGADVSMYRE